MLARYLLKIAAKVKRVILFMLVVLLLISPVKAQAFYPTHSPAPYAITAMAAGPFGKAGNFIIKEGLEIYKDHVKEQKKQDAEFNNKSKKNYENAKKSFITKKRKLQKDRYKELKRAFDKYKEMKDHMSRKELLELVKVLDILVWQDKKALLYWGEYYNIHHQIQDLILSISDKKAMEKLNEYLEDPAGHRDEYDINYNWKEKTALRVGLWILYSESDVIGVDAEFHKWMFADGFDRVKNWLNEEVKPKDNQQPNIKPLPGGGLPIIPGI